LRKDSQIPRRTKIREQIIKLWKISFKALKQDLSVRTFSSLCISLISLILQKAVGKISCTGDVWSNKWRRAFLAVTVHWLARIAATNGLVLKSALLGFHRLRGRHTGKNLAKTALHLLDCAGITVKVGFLLAILTIYLLKIILAWTFHSRQRRKQCNIYESIASSS
jgi:hypothetical protein